MTDLINLLNDLDTIIKEPIKHIRPKPRNDTEIIKYIKDTLDIFPSLSLNDKINGFVELYEYFNEDIVNDFIHRREKFKQTIMAKLKETQQQYPDEPRITSLTIKGCEPEALQMSSVQPAAAASDDAADANHDS
jgi:flagellar biosynthesis/type III secretory pathway chaperone